MSVILYLLILSSNVLLSLIFPEPGAETHDYIKPYYFFSLQKLRGILIKNLWMGI